MYKVSHNIQVHFTVFIIILHFDFLNDAVSQSQFDCDFETNLCSWQQDMTDVFNWTRAQGPTGSVNTGPTNDHTKQNRKSL